MFFLFLCLLYLFEVVRTLPFFAWTRLHIFLAILNAFLLLWESWVAMAYIMAYGL